MHDKNLYEYAVVRYVPHVEREEFINVGLIMMCKRRKWIRVELAPDFSRIHALNPPHSDDEITSQLSAFNVIASGSKDGGHIAGLDVTERFRWLSAVRSASVQTSRPHPGLCDDLDMTFDRLFTELVK